MTDPQRPSRRRALVTGGAIRVGRAIALGLANAGFDVAIAYGRSARAARATVAELRERGVHAVAIRADLRDGVAARRLVVGAARALGGLDVLVNNAAAFVRTPLATTTPAAWDAVLAVNVITPLVCARAAVACMTRGGHVINIGDAWARGAPAGWSVYAASKTALETVTRALAAELRPRGVAVNCVAPGPVLKPERLPAHRWRAITRGRAARLDDVVAAVVRLATSPSHVTGRVVTVTGRRRA